MDRAERLPIDDVCPVSGRRVEEVFDVLWPMLQVLIDRGHPVTAGVEDPGAGRRMLPEIPGEGHHLDPLVTRCEHRQYFRRAIYTSVIHEDRFEQAHILESMHPVVTKLVETGGQLFQMVLA